MDRSDMDHAACAQLLANSSEQILVPAPVVVELDWLASPRLGTEPFAAFLADIEEGALLVVDLVRSDYVRVRELLAWYSDLKLGFVDAAVVAIVERLEERKLATLDRRHFATVRARHVEAIELLPQLG